MKAYRFALTLALPVFALQACASHQPSKEVTAQMTRTEVVIQQADRSGVAVNSLPELQAAKDKYAKAQAATQQTAAADAQKGVNDLRKETDHNAAAPATTTP